VCACVTGVPTAITLLRMVTYSWSRGRKVCAKPGCRRFATHERTCIEHRSFRPHTAADLEEIRVDVEARARWLTAVLLVGMANDV
jgi:hypothetical protein